MKEIERWRNRRNERSRVMERTRWLRIKTYGKCKKVSEVIGWRAKR